MYPESDGCAQTADIKIQLGYDLHSPQFLNFQVEPGKNNDKTFGTECLATLRPGDLCIRNLDYYSLEDLDQMDQRGVYYIPRLNADAKELHGYRYAQFRGLKYVHMQAYLTVVFKNMEKLFFHLNLFGQVKG